ncbi:hypothetical protein HDU93_005003 [Gonapodya sp. JEL0774]|nr:hypothetical protein HDU93_005003 [Gonapodya sp. JEL0774]
MPVTLALLQLLIDLNSPSSSPTSFRPTSFIRAVMEAADRPYSSSPSPSSHSTTDSSAPGWSSWTSGLAAFALSSSGQAGRNSGGDRWAGWEQQDAHELFSLLSTHLILEHDRCLDPSAPCGGCCRAGPAGGSVQGGVGVGVGVGGVVEEQREGKDDKGREQREQRDQRDAQAQAPVWVWPELKNPLVGWVGSRVVCGECGYKTPLRHTPSTSLSLPPLGTLARSLGAFSAPELIEGVVCPRCTVARAVEGVGREVAGFAVKVKGDKTVETGTGSKAPRVGPASWMGKTVREVVGWPQAGEGPGRGEGGERDQEEVDVDGDANDGRGEDPPSTSSPGEAEAITPVLSTHTRRHHLAVLDRVLDAPCDQEGSKNLPTVDDLAEAIGALGMSCAVPVPVPLPHRLPSSPPPLRLALHLLHLHHHLTFLALLTSPTLDLDSLLDTPPYPVTRADLDMYRYSPRAATKRMETERWPGCLAVHVQRSLVMGARGMGMGMGRAVKDGRVVGGLGETIEVPVGGEVVGGARGGKPGARARYRLQAVLTHRGGHESGHFVAYRRVPPGGYGAGNKGWAELKGDVERAVKGDAEAGRKVMEWVGEGWGGGVVERATVGVGDVKDGQEGEVEAEAQEVFPPVGLKCDGVQGGEGGEGGDECRPTCDTTADSDSVVGRDTMDNGELERERGQGPNYRVGGGKEEIESRRGGGGAARRSGSAGSDGSGESEGTLRSTSGATNGDASHGPIEHLSGNEGDGHGPGPGGRQGRGRARGIAHAGTDGVVKGDHGDHGDRDRPDDGDGTGDGDSLATTSDEGTMGHSMHAEGENGVASQTMHINGPHKGDGSPITPAASAPIPKTRVPSTKPVRPPPRRPPRPRTAKPTPYLFSEPDRWFRISDDSVSVVEDPEVVYRMASGEVYMVFYERVDR